MSWGEVKKFLNSGMNTPLDILINNVKSVVDTISTNVNDVKSDVGILNTIMNNVKSVVDTISTNVNSVKSATAASSTANATGTLSQKLTYIISTLIGTTGATGGTATAGTIMAKLNKLLRLHTSSFQKTSFSGKASTTSNTELQILTLNNILLYGIYCTIGSSSSSYTITGYATINGVKLQIGPESDYTYDINLVNNFSSAIGVGFTDPQLSNDKSPFTLTEPIFVETLTMSVLSAQTNTNRVWFSGDIYYKQL